VEVLKSYSIPSQKDDYEAVLGLVKWCSDTYTSLKKHSDSIKKVSEYKPEKNMKILPKCIIPEEILRRQLREVEKF